MGTVTNNEYAKISMHKKIRVKRSHTPDLEIWGYVIQESVKVCFKLVLIDPLPLVKIKT